MLGRNSALGPASAAVTHSLVQRATETPPSTVLFATSLVEWGRLNKMNLTQTAPGPRSLTNDKCEELIVQLMLTEADIGNSPIGGIFSDGAFTPADVSPNSLLTHPSQLLQIGHGGIAVVWTPPAENLTTLPTRILHVSVPSDHLQRTTPNTLELLGQIIAYKLSRHVPTHIPAASDCQSVVSSLQEVQGYRRRPFGHTAKGIFYESMALADYVPRPTRWTRSHPERRLSDRSQWSYFDKGIHIADAAADSADAALSEVLTAAPPPIHVAVKCDDILRELLADGVWHWTYEDSDANSPILDDLMRHINFCALQRYTEKRDNVYRADAELPPKWEGINPNLAYSCLPSEPTNTRQFIQTAGRIWHKSYRYGTNRLKGILNSVEATQASVCTLCNRVEDPSHIYSRCKHPLVRRMRESTFDIQTRALDRLRTDPGCPSWERSFFRKFHKRSFSHRHDRAETCWNGTLNPSDLQSLLRLRMPPPVSLSFAKFQEFRKRFIKFVSPLSKAAVQMEILQQQSRLRAALRHLPTSLRRRTTTAPRSHIPSLHPSFRPTTPANGIPSNRPRRCITTPPPPRHLTQTYFAITSSGSDAATRSSVSLRTIPFHEHLTLQQNEHISSSSGRVFHHEDTEPPSPLGLQFHEPPD